MFLSNELDKLFRCNENYDVVKRSLKYYLNNNEISIDLYFSSFIVDVIKIDKIIETLNYVNFDINNITNSIKNHLINESIKEVYDLDEVLNEFYNGNLIIVINNELKVICAETRKYPGRLIGEPDSEKVVRGSRDGFTESIATNIGLVRMRIKSNKLNVERFEIGRFSKTRIALVYF